MKRIYFKKQNLYIEISNTLIGKQVYMDYYYCNFYNESKSVTIQYQYIFKSQKIKTINNMWICKDKDFKKIIKEHKSK